MWLMTRQKTVPVCSQISALKKLKLQIYQKRNGVHVWWKSKFIWSSVKIGQSILKLFCKMWTIVYKFPLSRTLLILGETDYKEGVRLVRILV